MTAELKVPTTGKTWENAVAQYRSLPRPIQNVIQLRNDRGGDMLPIFVGNIGDNDINVEEPLDLTDALAPDAQQDIEDWIRSLGPTSSSSQRQATDEQMEASGFDDDPDEWATDVVERDVNNE